MNHFINTGAPDFSRSRTVGLNQLTPAPFPVLLVGTTTQHSFFFANNGALESWSGAADYRLRVTIGDALPTPQGGKWGLQIDNSNAQSLRWDIDAAGLANIFNDDANVESEGGVMVEQRVAGQFLVANKETGAATGFTVDGAELFPDCTAYMQVLTEGDADHRQLVSIELRRDVPLQDAIWSEITSPYAGWSGYLALTSSATFELLRLRGERKGEFVECITLVTVDVIDPNGAPACYFQSPIILRAPNYYLEATPTTMTQNFFSKPLVTGLASNSANATLLGGLSTTNGEYPVGSVVQLMFNDNVVAEFTRLASTANQSVPWVVRPYDYSVLNPYQWILKGVQKDGQPCGYDNDTSLWHYMVPTGNANAVSVAADQTGFSLPA